jgi:hypothetical protein
MNKKISNGSLDEFRDVLSEEIGVERVAVLTEERLKELEDLLVAAKLRSLKKKGLVKVQSQLL